MDAGCNQFTGNGYDCYKGTPLRDRPALACWSGSFTPLKISYQRTSGPSMVPAGAPADVSAVTQTGSCAEQASFPPTLQQGPSDTFVAVGFAPGSSVEIAISGPSNSVNTAQADSSCTVRMVIQTGASNPPGVYAIRATGDKPTGGRTSLTATYELTAGQGPMVNSVTGTLPTGGSPDTTMGPCWVADVNASGIPRMGYLGDVQDDIGPRARKIVQLPVAPQASYRVHAGSWTTWKP
jgi:hypothetical protein